MEHIDVLDECGAPTGATKLRDEVHRDGDWHRAVHVWVVNSRGEVLLQKRSATIDLFRNLWDISLVGHMRSGEKSADAALRELKEELGITVEEHELQFVAAIPSQLKDGMLRDNQFSDIYLLRRDVDIEKLEKQKEEVAEITFMPLQELQTLVRKNAGRFVPRTKEYEEMFRLLAR
ncbi:MAG: NUDIX domain-containing protein [Candidatus Jorgensenbacteria bacterium]